ncbi:hypothetical protein V1525DRAFT_389492 [Lipomyces kononenkoae]|uniref:Uncharacterized protein n=1 Tax=Lipomyces kononenkoae TaxID=34357 RepID=A0ACC3SXS5_LIPKO
MLSYHFIRFFKFFAGSLPGQVLDRVAHEEHNMLELVRCGDLSDDVLDDDDLEYIDHFNDLNDMGVNLRYGGGHSGGNQFSSCVDEEESANPMSLPSHRAYIQNGICAKRDSNVVRSSGQVRLYTPERYPQYLWYYYTPIRQRRGSSLLESYCHIVPRYQWPRMHELTCPKRRKCEARIMRRSPIDRTILQAITEVNVPTEFDNAVKCCEGQYQ